MQVQCSSCSKEINIPDDKVPKGQAFNLTCPGCKTKMRVDQHLQPPEPEPAFGGAEVGGSLDTTSMIVDEDFEDDDEEIQENKLVGNEIVDSDDADEDQKNKDLFRMSDKVVLESAHQVMLLGTRSSPIYSTASLAL